VQQEKPTPLQGPVFFFSYANNKSRLTPQFIYWLHKMAKIL